MDNQHTQSPTSASQQQSSSSSTGPQIRSRITVVCAECKRLKLKCDRRAPCGSCTKRDTVVRCIYSPAAAEKVDLHSLNNRLIQVEAILAMITAGQNPPAFQSSYPITFPAGPSNPQQSTFSSAPSSNAPRSHQHQHHHHYAVPSTQTTDDSLTLSAGDLASIWLNDLELGVAPSSSAPAPGSSTTQAQPESFSNAESAGIIKLEPSPIDIELSRTRSSLDDASRSILPLHPPSPHQRNSLGRSEQQQQRSSAQLLLPALSIYYPPPSIPPPGTSASSSTPFPHHPPSASSSSALHSTSTTGISVNNGNVTPSHLQPQHAKPQVTPALLALLPSLPASKRLLQNAHDVFRVRPIPFEFGPAQGWKRFESRCLTLLGGGANKERDRERERKEREREKAREARRARQIYFSGISGLQSSVAHDAEMEDVVGGSNSNKSMAKTLGDADDAQGSGGGQSLAFFGVMCAVLAVGASITSAAAPTNSTDAFKESPSFLYALSQQALGVWDTHASSTASGHALTTAEETEKLDYLLACIAGLCYLLFTSPSPRATESGDTEREGAAGTGLIYPLVGKLVNAARGMGLAKDSSVLSSVLSRKTRVGGDESASSERHALGTSNGSGASARGASKREREAERERAREEWKKMIWWEVLFYDLFTADALGHQSYIPAHLFGMKLPGCSSATVVPQADEQYSDGDESDPGQRMNLQIEEFRPQAVQPRISQSTPVGDVCQREEDYLGARYRLTQLAQNIKNRLTHPDCCCGYTLDQAAHLEADIRRWQAALPVGLRWSEPPMPDGSSPPIHRPQGTTAEKVLHLQSCELAVMSNILVLKVYTPFMRHMAASSNQSGPSAFGFALNGTPALEAAPINASAAQTSVQAAQMLIRAVKDAYATQASISMFPTSPFSSPSPSASPGKTPAWPAAVSPAMFDLYPLEKIVFDAAAICAHAGLGGKATATSTLDIDAALDDATVALGALLIEQGAPAVGPLPEPNRQVADVLYKRVVTRANAASHGMKRKRSQVNTDNPFGVIMPFYAQASNTISIPGADQEWAASSSSGSMGQHQHQPGAAVGPEGSPQNTIPTGNFSQDHLGRAEHQKQDLASAVRHAAAAHTAERGDDEKEKKYAKKAPPYPSVGVRVRPSKETSSRARQHSLSGGSKQPLLTTTPRPLPGAGEVMAYQQQLKQKQKLQAIPDGPSPATSGGQAPASAGYEEDPNRSRSSSFSHVQPQQQLLQRQPDGGAEDIQFPYFGGSTSSDMMNMQMMPGRRFSKHEQAQAQRPLTPEHPPFTPHIFDRQQAMYDQTQSYDPAHGGSSAPVEGMSYSTVPSPFSNGGAPTSSSSSPFTTTSVVGSGHPPTPTFAPHHPPVFEPQPSDHAPTSSPTEYYHAANTYNDASYPGPGSSHQQHTIPLGMNMDQNGNMIAMSGAQTYDKAQATMFEIKTEIEHHQIVHHQHQQHQMRRQTMEGPYEDNMAAQGHQMGMGMPAPASWTSPEQQQHHQQQHPSSSNQQFWNNGTEYRFYPA